MPVPRVSCSDPAVPQAKTRQPSGGIAIGLAAPAQMSDPIRAYLARQQNWLTTHEQNPEVTTELLENDVAAGRALIEGRFARWNESIAKQHMDWPCQHCPDGAGPPGDSERMADGPAGGGVSARTLWLGGIAFAVLAVTIISVLATVEAIRPLPFEIWAQRNLIQLTDSIPGAMATNAQDPDQLVREPERAPNAGSGPVAAPDSFIQPHEALTLVSAEIEARTKEVEQATAKAREMDQKVAAVRTQSEQRIAAADAARVEAEARLSEMRDNLQRAEQEKARIGADLAKVQGELVTAKEQVAAARQEQTQVQQRVAALEDERDDLSTRLADATARLGPSEAAKVQLEREVAELREAARTAAAATHQLIEALTAIGLAAGSLEADSALLAEWGTPAAGDGSDAAAPVGNVAAEAAPSQGPAPTSADADRQWTKTASATLPGGGEGAHLDQRGILGRRPAVLPTLAGLPLERRDRVQGLLAELPSKLEHRGLMTTVPGELLFTKGSDQVQTAAAYDTLAKVAELIGMYDDRQVLIIGHSDARGDAARNRQLSERRAERVKQILVNSFEIDADRLSTEGRGDTLPIASNATPEGRRVNRRVEVLVLN